MKSHLRLVQPGPDKFEFENLQQIEWAVNTGKMPVQVLHFFKTLRLRFGCVEKTWNRLPEDYKEQFFDAYIEICLENVKKSSENIYELGSLKSSLL